ncbi:MAG: prolipoprotein diacylglyceryl transferase, partial [Parasporobacterium sp.]|nr:prolipoprotein diacylglyceryl transferase [Parasporobacterium sp.]
MADIIFPNLGISFGDISTGFTIFGFNIAYYGVLIAIGMILAVVLAMVRAKKTNQDPDDYIDLGIAAIVVGVICARLYYVLFRLDFYLANPAEIINIRGGGLAIYGGIIGGIAAGFVVARCKKINFLRVLDTVAPGIALAQAIGRWGNFINREAFGKFTDGLFAMQIPYNDASGVINLYKDLPEMQEIINNTVTIDGIQYIQVHPTFLYESLWCLLLFVLIIAFRKFQRYNGEIILWYLGGYALERAFVEGLRIDQLRIAGTDLAVSQLLSIAIAAAAILLLIINRVRLMTGSFK